MTNYDFSTLNSTDLENLVCELLNAKQPEGSTVSYRTFKEGKDQGIDLLYSTSANQHEHVGQVKHYLRSGIALLLKDLRGQEAEKVRKLAPNKYIFATSLPLSKANCSDIESIFSPYINDINDIYGKDDLNRLITSHKYIEKSNYKLWFSSVNILESILNTDLEFRSSSFIKDELIRRIKLFVITPIFNEARQFLKEKKFLIITGDPGTGKTTLAEMLIYEYVKEGYRLSFIIDDVHDAEREINNDDSKQIIYFDDFLGSNEVEFNKAMASEARLLRLISQIEKKQTKLLILTTRSNLISKAINRSEKLKHRQGKLNRKIIDLKDYTNQVKEQILLNHIEESEIGDEYKVVISNKHLKRLIINHQNFTPRAVEYLTNPNHIKRIALGEYEDFIRSTLDSPINIWEHAYLNQTDDFEKLLLQTLLTFGDSAEIELLNKAFNKRMEYEVNKRNLTSKPHCWKITLHQLMDGFIIQKDEKISFSNPSLVDFLVSYLQQDENEVIHIVNNIIHIDQLSKRLFRLSSTSRPAMPLFLQELLLNDYSSILSDEYYDDELIRLALIIHQYIVDKRSVKVISEILNKIEDWSDLVENFELNYYFNEFIDILEVDSDIFEIVKNNVSEIIKDVILGLWSIDEIIDVIKKYSLKFSLEDFLPSEVENHILQLFEEEISDAVSELKDWVMSEGDEVEKRNEIVQSVKEFQDYNIILDVDFKEFDDVDWWEVANNNYYRYAMEKND
jgi:DNA polymerase III delta prime subunit